MNDEFEIECTECGWQGYISELLCRIEDAEKSVEDSRFDVCPECLAIDEFEDIEQETSDE